MAELRHIDVGTHMPFTAQAEAHKLTKRQCISIWEDICRTRESLAMRNWNLDAAIYDAYETIRKLATIEEALGYEAARNWLERGYAHALKVLAEKQEAAS